MERHTVDAVIIGAGHHGLVTAALLADAGWEVMVFEERSKTGGAVASTTMDGFIVDEFSSCHPLGKASPVLQALELEAHGLQWVDHRPALAHVADGSDDIGAHIGPTSIDTAASLDADHAGDGEAWLKMVSGWNRVKEPLIDALVRGWPPVKPGAKLARILGAAGLLDFTRFALLPSHQLGQEWFGGNRARDLIAGNTAHADVSPLAPISGFLGWLLAMLAQDVGFVMPLGGAGALADALTSRAVSAGATVETDCPVQSITVEAGRATGVHLADGRHIQARRAVIADTSAPALYERLLPQDAVPRGIRSRLGRFAWDPATIKLNLLLDGPMPWRAKQARGAAVVHVGHSASSLVGWHADIATGKIPERAFALVGQTTSADASRSPAGTESLWAYTHLPAMPTDRAAGAAQHSLESVEAVFDDLAPGWRELERNRWVQSPADMESANANLTGGAVGGGTSQLFQQGPWRPIMGLGGPRTHLHGLYLASAATHPGGAVQGGAGYNAARAALRDARWWSRPLGTTATRVQHMLQRRDPEF